MLSPTIISRRGFLASSAAVVAASTLPLRQAKAAPAYRRYNVTSPQGQKMLESYKKGVQAMLGLPAEHPHNWFRNAIVHLLDCPHGNWWFYVWHRGYLGHFERTIRRLSGDGGFTIPYWDWTQLQQLPDGMFDGVLTPTDKGFEPYSGNLERFREFVGPALSRYWDGLSTAQISQMSDRGFKKIKDVWDFITATDATTNLTSLGDYVFSPTCSARYVSRANPKLDDTTAYDASEFIVYSGLLPTDFYNPINHLSFSSTKTTSHHIQAPNKKQSFSTLEGLPHNLIHNYIGGQGHLDPGPFGNMTNFLSPVDPIFFLHHSNMDRLWDVWTRKQMHLGAPYLPSGHDLQVLSDEPFLFFVDEDGKFLSRTAGDYLSMQAFDYDYEPGFGEKIIGQPATPLVPNVSPPIVGTLSGGVGSLVLPRSAVQNFLSSVEERSLFAEITVAHPGIGSSTRELDVLINAPRDVTQVSVTSPYYAGTIAFFGSAMAGMKMSSEATFSVPIPKREDIFSALDFHGNSKLDIRVVPSRGRGVVPAVKAVHVAIM